jgi:hypothetical protein
MVTVVRQVTGGMTKPEGTMTWLGSSYQILTRALVQDMQGDTKLSAILWRDRTESPKDGFTSVRVYGTNSPLELGRTVQEVAQGGKVTLLVY